MNFARRSLASHVAVLAAATALVTPFLAGRADAHHGYAGPVRLYLESVSVEPQPEGWLIRAALNDTGSGKAAPGYIVKATGSGPQGATFGPVVLGGLDADGRYEAGLGPLPAGDWSLTVDVTDAPGSEERAIPITRTWLVTLQPGAALDVIGQLPAPGDGAPSRSGPGPITTPLLVACLAALLALTVTWLRRRSAAVSPPRVPAAVPQRNRWR